MENRFYEHFSALAVVEFADFLRDRLYAMDRIKACVVKTYIKRGFVSLDSFV